MISGEPAVGGCDPAESLHSAGATRYDDDNLAGFLNVAFNGLGVLY